ncbi:hypothetical protein DFH07DRAFT_771639 [Mycena maculata]|uniref:Uncharacterized protein n=1 Tax=Mycena maculata TaxID=230809 RepID=A0AAD7NHM3_9AGAR|nr:hypothetical protein DFH07DRAFT_771639 [Mycena maculata]
MFVGIVSSLFLSPHLARPCRTLPASNLSQCTYHQVPYPALALNSPIQDFLVLSLSRILPFPVPSVQMCAFPLQPMSIVSLPFKFQDLVFLPILVHVNSRLKTVPLVVVKAAYVLQAHAPGLCHAQSDTEVFTTVTSSRWRSSRNREKYKLLDRILLRINVGCHHSGVQPIATVTTSTLSKEVLDTALREYEEDKPESDGNEDGELADVDMQE